MPSTRRLFHVVAIVGCLALVLGCSDSSNPMGPEGGSDGEGGNGGGGTGDDTSVTFSSEEAPGDSARAFLTGDEFSVLSVEVDYMEGYEPTDEAYDSLKTELREHLDKSTIRVGPESSIPAAGDGPYTASDIRDLEEQYRDRYTTMESDTLWAYFLVLDGNYEDDSVVGLAYYNTSMAFFGKTIDEISGGISQPSTSKVEATVFRHEFGHVLGLVNNGIPPQQDHHDEAHGAHCDREACVMYYAIETRDYFANIFDGTVPGFEVYCTEDMAAQR